MHAVARELTVGVPAQQVYDYVNDVANLPTFLADLFNDFRLTREETIGVGAGFRFRLATPFNRFGYGDLVLRKPTSPNQIVFEGRGGKYDRTGLRLIFAINPASSDSVRLKVSYETFPGLPSDSLAEAMSFQSFYVGRRLTSGLKDLRSILEEGAVRGARATIAGGARKPASQFQG